MRKITLHSVLCVLLVVLGLVQSYGRLTGHDTIKNWAFGMAASPLPEVFGGYRGHEPMSHLHFLAPYFYDGSQKFIPLDRKNAYGAYSQWAHITRFGPYGAVVSWLPIMDHTISASIMKQGLCRGGPFARRYGLTKDVKEFRLWITDQEGETVKRGELFATCDD